MKRETFSETQHAKDFIKLTSKSQQSNQHFFFIKISPIFSTMIESAFPGVGHGIFDTNCEKMTNFEIEGFLKQTRETMLTYMGVVCNYEICGRSISQNRDAFGFLMADSKKQASFSYLEQ